MSSTIRGRWAPASRRPVAGVVVDLVTIATVPRSDRRSPASVVFLLAAVSGAFRRTALSDRDDGQMQIAISLRRCRLEERRYSRVDAVSLPNSSSAGE